MRTKPILYYEARIAFGLASFLPLLLLPAYTLLALLAWRPPRQPPSITEPIAVIEALLTLSAGLACAHLMTIEREEMFDGIRRSYPESTWRIPLMRTITAMLFILVIAFISAAIFRIAYGVYDLQEVLIPAFIPAFYLGSIALLVNNISGSYWVAGGIVAAYWYGDMTSVGRYTGVVYLFNHSRPNPNIDLPLNQWVLVLGTFLCIGLNIAYTYWRRQRGG